MASTAPSSGRSAWRGTGPGGPLRSQSAERVLPGEDALVPEAARQGPAGAAALAALVGLLPGVDPLVLNEAGALAEGLTALLTRKGLLAVVEPQVRREVKALHEGLPAVAARVGLLASVDPLVLHQVRLAALGRLFPAWRLPLLQDVGPSRGGLGAHGPVQCCFARRGSPRLLDSERLLQLGRSYPGSLLRGLPGGSPGWLPRDLPGARRPCVAALPAPVNPDGFCTARQVPGPVARTSEPLSPGHPAVLPGICSSL